MACKKAKEKNKKEKEEKMMEFVKRKYTKTEIAYLKVLGIPPKDKFYYIQKKVLKAIKKKKRR